ncbi:MAG: hypothetical protein ACOCU8_03180 [Patescibacteria group bacterium]
MIPAKIKPRNKDTLLQMVKTAVGSKMFQTAYVEVAGRRLDLTKKGELSCAFFVSSILAIFGLIDRLHLTVEGTIKAMEKAGWQKTKKLEPGTIIIWDSTPNFKHQHIGFYLGNKKAISNIYQMKVPGKHHYTFGSEKSKTYRPIITIYHHSDLK